ncbi:hypothetical protein GIW50_06410 [Pseudomonas syringae]|uniref:Uncharacterized protein n=1 Tax=Pseudomonas syringae TaxID=317 RepID=A0A9Q3WZP6_PSESX|nr:hypothetical protein [Pseudomonas syringae]MCF5062431.1 hypothetical protein [Pseudomonas syringae]MCF5075749.1 hypothetical protein [Pseudomonas syringae]MCF5118043.1 hypothetical protein [Pseudomonas syringae]MCF5378529.1 hypothetical protein [Pseudomonas syringae]
MTRKQVFWFWGGMDAIYLARYVITSAMGGRVPYFSDAQSALWLLREHSVVPLYMFGFAMLLQVSVIISCVLFFLKSAAVKWVVYLQTPLRLALVVPSVSLLFLGAKAVPSYNLVLMAALLVLSETAKVWSVWRWSRRNAHAEQPA